MNVSAVGFLFQNKVKSAKGLLKGKNYTCIIHKVNPEGGYSKNVITSPIPKKSTLDIVSPESALADVCDALKYVNKSNDTSKFIGATIKDGVKETEVHSVLFDKLFAVRTKDELGKNHFRLLNASNTQKVLANNLNLQV